MSVTAEYRQITGGRETLVSETAFADEVAGRRALWWAGVPGLDPAYAAPNALMGAQAAAMACAAHVLGSSVTDTRWRGGASPLTEKFFEWLAATTDDYDAYLRRLALRLVASTPRIPSEKVLEGAKALHGGVT